MGKCIQVKHINVKDSFRYSILVTNFNL